MSEIYSLSWVADGIEEAERQAIQELVNIAVAYDTGSIAKLINKSWVKDGLDETEVSVVGRLAQVGESARDVGERILAMAFLNDVEVADLESVNHLVTVADGDKGLFWAVAEEDWVEDGLDEVEIVLLRELQELTNRTEAATTWVNVLSSGGIPISPLERILGQSYDTDGSGRIEHNEVFAAVSDYHDGKITDEQARDIIAIYGFSEAFISAPSLVELAMASHWYRDYSTNEDANRTLRELEAIDVNSPELVRALSSWPWIFDDHLSPQEKVFIGEIAYLVEDSPDLALQWVQIPWIADGFGVWEQFTVSDLGFLFSYDPTSIVAVWDLPWVADGLAPDEGGPAFSLLEIFDEDGELGKELLHFQWLQDNVNLAERIALTKLRNLARDNLSLAFHSVRSPFMEAPFLQRDEYALNALVRISHPGHGLAALLAELNDQPWFSDGIDDEEAALLHAIAKTSGDLRQALVQSPHMSSTTVALPSSGLVGLSVVRHTPFPPGDSTLSTMEVGVRVIEDFVGEPLPVDDLILLLVEPELWSLDASGRLTGIRFGSGIEPDAYARKIMLVRAVESTAPVRTLYHEIGHYYNLAGPLWVREGAANFLEAYTVAQTGGQGLDERRAHLESSGRCKRENLWEHINNYVGGLCDYELGERFFLAMHDALGPEAVAAAIRDLHRKSQFLEPASEEGTYHAFLSNVPLGQEEAFMAAYRRYHGGPIIDRAPDSSPDLTALQALYNATGGEDWINRSNWASNALPGALHGVGTDPEGRVTEIDLPGNGLEGDLPPELGNLTHLRWLSLQENQLTGVIPAELGNLAQLSDLTLRFNQLSGQIPPELGNLSSLRSLFLDNNQLTGQIPPELGKLHNLEKLWLHGNQLSGEIPPELGKLTNLKSVLLYGNQFTGCLPDSWRDIPQNDFPERFPFCGDT